MSWHQPRPLFGSLPPNDGLDASRAFRASWDRIGPLLQPEDDEIGVTEPWVVASQRRLFMFYVCEDDVQLRIDMAVSDDGLEWHRHGTARSPGLQSGDSMAVRSPCVIRLLGGRVRLWLAARHVEDTAGAYRLWSTDYHGGP